MCRDIPHMSGLYHTDDAKKKAHLFCDRDVSIVTSKHIQRRRHSNNVTTVVLILIAVVIITLLPYMVAIQIYFLSELHEAATAIRQRHQKGGFGFYRLFLSYRTT